LKSFKESIFIRLNNLRDKAKELSSKGNQQTHIDFNDLIEISKIVIEVQLLKNNFLKYREDIQKYQDEIIDDYDLV
jgi:hypothetical protein